MQNKLLIVKFSTLFVGFVSVTAGAAEVAAALGVDFGAFGKEGFVSFVMALAFVSCGMFASSLLFMHE